MASRTISTTNPPVRFGSHQQVLKSLLLILSISLVIATTVSAENEKPVIKQTSAEKTEAEQTQPQATTETEQAAPATTALSLLEQTNAYRQRYNLKPLVLDEKLSKACEGLAEVMARTNRMSHSADGRSPSSRVRSTGYKGGHVLENIAYRWDRKQKSNEQFAQATLRQWINSSGHRRNLLNSRITQCGIAFATNPRSGKTFAAMVYARGNKTEEN